MKEVDDGPGHAGGAVEDGEYDDPREEEDEDVGRPHARVREPLGVPVQIRRRHRSDVHVLWPFSPSQYSQMTDLSRNPKILLELAATRARVVGSLMSRRGGK